MNLNPISAIVGAVGGYFSKREDRKMHKKTLDGKIAMKRNDNTTEVVFNDQEWEQLSKMNESSTWKDEWITVIMTLPIPILFFSVFVGVLIGNPLVIEAATDAIKSLKEFIPNYGYLLGLIIMAALGIKAVKNNK